MTWENYRRACVGRPSNRRAAVVPVAAETGNIVAAGREVRNAAGPAFTQPLNFTQPVNMSGG